MYTCGPSTYQQAHIGNYRTFLFEDVFQRYLEFEGYKVERIMTLTDVEDKAISQASKDKITVEELTTKNEEVFFEDFEKLKIKKPDYSVQASSAVDQAVKIISKLNEEGVAYWYSYRGEKNAYFDPLKFEGFGKLAHLDMSKWPKKKRRFHKDTYPGTPWNMGDFVLWHGCNQEAVCFDTAIGKGRPAWNIQDAAIVTKHLGFSVDVACGGIDNLVRHHDYTLAVAESYSGEQFSRYWLHGGHLLIDGKKMSKSKGNVYYIHDVVEKGFSGAHLRFFLLYGDYKRKLNFTWKKLSETSRRLDCLRNMVNEILETKPKNQLGNQETLCCKLISDFATNMDDDLNVKDAFDSLYENICKLYERPQILGVEDIKNVEEKLGRINTVLQFIF
jgi:cysteinyl-tRNA synthetase